MRRTLILSCVIFSSVVLLLPALAAAQITVISGYASNGTPVPGLQATPFVPLLTTPSIALGSAPLQVGASNATAGNVVGATDATLSMDTSGANATFARPVWYGQAISPGPREKTGSAESAGPQIEQGFQFGMATVETSNGVARLAAGQRHLEPAKHIYTNADIARLDKASGMVK